MSKYVYRMYVCVRIHMVWVWNLHTPVKDVYQSSQEVRFTHTHAHTHSRSAAECRGAYPDQALNQLPDIFQHISCRCDNNTRHRSEESHDSIHDDMPEIEKSQINIQVLSTGVALSNLGLVRVESEVDSSLPPRSPPYPCSFSCAASAVYAPLKPKQTAAVLHLLGKKAPYSLVKLVKGPYAALNSFSNGSISICKAL